MTAPPTGCILEAILTPKAIPRARTLLVCAAGVVLVAAPSRAAPPQLLGLGVDETLAGGAVLAEALNQATMPARGLPLCARIVLEPAEFNATTENGLSFEKLDERIERYGLKGVAVVLALRGPLPPPQASDNLRRFLHTLAERYRGRIKAYQIGELASAGSAPDVRDYAFVLKLAAIEVRGADPDAMIVQGSLRPDDAAWQERLYAEDVAPYLDAVAITGHAEELTRAIPAFEKLLTQEHPKASIMIAGLPLNEDPPTAVIDLLNWQLSHLASRATLTTYALTLEAAAAALPVVERLKDLFAADLIPLDDKDAGLKLSTRGERVTDTLPHSLFCNLADLRTYLVYRGQEAREGTLEVELTDPTGRKLTIRDPLAGRSEAVRGVIWDRSAHTTRASVPLQDRPFVLDAVYGPTAYIGRSEVSAGELPPVGEIVFRHQLTQSAQEARLQTYMARAQMETHFRLSATNSFDVVTENHFYCDKDSNEWEETSFTLNGTPWGSKRPALPLPQADKVVSLPLDLHLTRDYRYRLEGVERVGEHECYAVRFDPISESQSLYRGTVWIDTKSFAKMKVQAVQTHLGAPVVSSEEIQYFTPEVTAGGDTVYLLSHFTRRQIMLIAGHSLLVEHVVRFSGFEVNAPGFADRRAASRAGQNIMYRETDEGPRSFVRRGDRRVVEEHSATTFKALAGGVMVDPSFDFPLPVLGFNYLNLHFVNRNTQATLLFGGLLAMGNVQRPRVLGDRVDASLDLFGIAVPINERILGRRGELRSERLRRHPFSTGLNLGYQLTPFQRLVGSYRFRFDGYARDTRTALDFASPVSTVTNGFGLVYEYQRGGYSLRAHGFRYLRASWRSWGHGEGFSPNHRTYHKYGLSLSKDFFIHAFHKIHLNAAYFGGRRLDRFSTYQFGQFDDNRIHGVPASGVRFWDVGMVRGSYSFNFLELYRLDLFLDRALGRQRGPGQSWRSITGVGLGLSLRAPFGTLLRGEIGKSFLPDPYSRSRSVVAQVLLLKPLY